MKQRIILWILVITSIIGSTLTLSFHYITTQTISIAHRGFGIAIQNTSFAFKNAKHFDAIECDVWISSDNVFVISHNGTLSSRGGQNHTQYQI